MPVIAEGQAEVKNSGVVNWGAEIQINHCYRKENWRKHDENLLYKLMNPQVAVTILSTFTIAVAIAGIALEVVFVTNDIDTLTREFTILTAPKLPN